MSRIDDFFRTLRAVGVMNFGGLEETGEALFMRQYLMGRRSPVVFDVGANVGEYTRCALEANDTADVYAFEPHPRTFATLSAALAGSRARTLQYGLGERQERLALHDCVEEGSTHYASLHLGALTTIGSGSVVTYDVLVRRLDEVAAELGVAAIDLLKIDTEGHEMAVLRGASGLLERQAVRCIQFEFNEACIATRTYFKDFWDLLSDDFRFYRLLPSGVIGIEEYVPSFCEIFAFQNVVCLHKSVSMF
jgi:FkbM family methyltransferase